MKYIYIEQNRKHFQAIQ